MPYRLTATITDRSGADENSRASVKLVAGAGLFIVWITLIGTAAWILAGWRAGIGALVALPVLALATLILLEKSGDAWRDARRFFLLRSRVRALDDLRLRQRSLAQRVSAMRDRTEERG